MHGDAGGRVEAGGCRLLAGVACALRAPTPCLPDTTRRVVLFPLACVLFPVPLPPQLFPASTVLLHAPACPPPPPPLQFVASTFLNAVAPLGQLVGDELVAPLSQVGGLLKRTATHCMGDVSKG